MRRSERRFRALTMATTEVVYTMSPDWSEMWRLHGRGFVRDTDKPRQHWLEEYIDAGDRPGVLSAIRRAIDTRSIFDLEHRVRRVDGTLGWTHSRAVPILDDVGAIEEWIGAASDITVRKAQEEALRESEAKYRNLFESMTEGYAVLELIFDGAGSPVDFLYLETNPAFTVHATRPMKGRRIREMIPDFDQSWIDQYGHVARTGEPLAFEHVFAWLGDQWFRTSAFRVGDAASHRVGVLFENVTERKRQEANQTLLLGVSDDLSRLSSEEDVLHVVGRKLAEHLGLTCYRYVDIDEERREATLRHVWNALEVPAIFGPHPIDGFLSPANLDSLRRGQNAIVHDVQDETPGDDAPANLARKAGSATTKIAAYVVIPHRQDVRWKAYFVAAVSVPRKWPVHEVELIQEVAHRVFPRVERLRAEAALRASERKYRSLIESIDEGFCILERVSTEPLDFRYLEANHAFSVHAGVHDVVGRTIREVVPKEPEEWFETYDRVLTTHQPVRFEHALVTLGRVLELYVFPVADYGDLRLAVIFKDVTERRAAMDALQESEERLRLFGEASSDVLWVRDAETLRWEYLSPAFEAIYGRPRESVLGEADFHRWLDLIEPEDRAFARESAERVRSGERVTFEYRIRRPDGRICWVRDTDFPIRDRGGAIRRIGGIGEDVTEQRATEQALREWNETLEQRVAQRTQEVRDLAESLSTAEQEERQRIAQVLHDDLQQLLYGIQLKVAFALDRMKKGEVDVALERGKRTIELLDQAITRTRQLTVDLNPPLFEEEGLLGALEWLRSQMRDLHGLEVAIFASADVDVPHDLRALLFQVTRELLFNVAKHAETGRACVDVVSEAGIVRVAVTDEGRGFDAASVLAGEQRGGVGLFRARERLRLRGGDLQIDSQPGVGTRVVASAQT